MEELGVPQIFWDSYFGAWRCQVCIPDNPNDPNDDIYFYNDNQDECHDGNWQFTYFNFTPLSLEDPCNSGGTLQIMDFDQNGNAVIQEVQVPPGIAIASRLGLQPFGIGADTWCTTSGWCLFEPDLIYNGPNANVNKPLLATWALEESCVSIDWDDPNEPTPPCNMVSNPCPAGLQCLEGNCYQPCVNGQCINGECVEGLCIESEVCNPSCPGGYDCHEGNCYIDEGICEIDVKITGGSGVKTFNYWHNSPGTNIIFEHNTLIREDKIHITGSGIDHTIDCIGTNGWAPPITFTLGTGNILTVEVTPCEAGSEYHFKIHCEGLLQNDPSVELRGTNDGNKDIFIHPNPFVSNIDITVHHNESSFEGQVILLDNLGREVIKKELIFESGQNTLNIDGLEELMKGLYIVLISKEGKVHASRKVVKLE